MAPKQATSSLGVRLHGLLTEAFLTLADLHIFVILGSSLGSVMQDRVLCVW